MKSESQLRKSIMRRVWGVYLMRRFAAPTTRVIVFLAICLAIASSVSMPNVIENTLHASNALVYVLSALAGTKSFVQLGVIAAGLIAIWSAVDVVRSPEEQLA